MESWTGTPCQRSRESCLRRLSHPMGYLCLGQPTTKVSLIPGDQDILARDDSRSTPPVGIPLPPVLRLAEACHHGRPDGIAHDDWELRTHLLRVQHALVCQGCLGRGAFSTQSHRPRSPSATTEGRAISDHDTRRRYERNDAWPCPKARRILASHRDMRARPHPVWPHGAAQDHQTGLPMWGRPPRKPRQSMLDAYAE
jgi:hypothetical protein